MEQNILVAGVGILLALAFAYVPGLKKWYDAQESERKALVMLGALLVTAGIVAGGSCWLGYGWVTCDEAGGKVLLELFIAALIGNQAAYTVGVRPFKSEASESSE